MNSPDYIVILTSMFRGDATRRGMVGNSRSNGTKCFFIKVEAMICETKTKAS